MNVTVTAASVELDDGTQVAQIEAVTIGGGVRIVGQVHGQDVEEADPVFHRFHCRLLSPDRMIPDVLHETDTYDEAVDIATTYAKKRAEYASTVAGLADVLKV